MSREGRIGLDRPLPRFLSERHYTVKEISAFWCLSQKKIRELFANEAGVMREGKPTRMIGSRQRRGYFTIRVAESALLRAHRILTGTGWCEGLATEQHYTLQELATAWQLSYAKVRWMFADEKGVLRVGKPSRCVGRKLTRRMYTIRVPESVARRVYECRTLRK